MLARLILATGVSPSRAMAFSLDLVIRLHEQQEAGGVVVFFASEDAKAGNRLPPITTFIADVPEK